MTSTNSKQSLLLVALFFLSDLSHQINCAKVTQKIQNKQVLISVGSENYALASDVLLVNSWEALTKNGNSIKIVTSTCEEVSKSVLALNKSEQNVIDFLRNGFAKMNPSSAARGESWLQFTLNPAEIPTSHLISSIGSPARAGHFVTQNGWSISSVDGENFAATSSGLADGLAHILVNRDYVTFVYLDEKIDMKPYKCLNQMQQVLVGQIKLELGAHRANYSSRSADEIRHIRLNSDHLIGATETNYALTSSSLLDRDWKTASINGNILSIYTKQCGHILKDLTAINDSESRAIRDAVTKLERAKPWSGSVYSLMKFRMSPTEQVEFDLVSAVNIANLTNHIQGNHLCVSKMGANNYSISSQDLLTKRVFINNDIATLVYKSNFIEMIPLKCVSGVQLGVLNDARMILGDSDGDLKKIAGQ